MNKTTNKRTMEKTPVQTGNLIPGIPQQEEDCNTILISNVKSEAMSIYHDPTEDMTQLELDTEAIAHSYQPYGNYENENVLEETYELANRYAPEDNTRNPKLIDVLEKESESSAKKVERPTLDAQSEQCDLCFNYFRKSYIWIHKTNIHKVLKIVPRRKNFRCRDCFKTYESKSDLIRHRTLAHGTAKIECNLCKIKILKEEYFEHKLKVHNKKTSTTYCCKQCQQKFNSRGDLIRHKSEIHSLPGVDRPMASCAICFKTFLKTSLNRHKFEVHNIRDLSNLRKGKKPTECKSCKQVFERRYEYNKHTCKKDSSKDKDKENVKKYKQPNLFCLICQITVEEKSMTKHNALKHGIVKARIIKRKNFSCQDCDEVFANKKVYLSHRKIEHLGMLKEFKCKMCLDSFDTQELYNEHIEEFGSHGGQFTCYRCNKVFQSESGLRMHQNIHEKKFKCDICNMNLSSMSSLQVHQTKHSGLKPFQCELCKKAFPYMSSLKYHMRTHEDKKYSCQFCDQKFTFSFNFARHIELHHRKTEEKVVCEHCGDLFAKHRIKEHLARHGEPTLPCELCGKKFKIMNQVRKHKNQVHKKELARLECPVCFKVFIRKEMMDIHLTKHRSDLQNEMDPVKAESSVFPGKPEFSYPDLSTQLEHDIILYE